MLARRAPRRLRAAVAGPRPRRPRPGRRRRAGRAAGHRGRPGRVRLAGRRAARRGRHGGRRARGRRRRDRDRRRPRRPQLPRRSARAGEDWLLLRRNPPDAALTGYERAVWQALLGDADEVALSALRARRLDLSAAREELYADVVRHAWFARRPDHERTRWLLAGVVLAAVGVAATVVLALTIGHALLGLAVVIGGLGLALGARLHAGADPARQRAGAAGPRPARLPARQRRVERAGRGPRDGAVPLAALRGRARRDATAGSPASPTWTPRPTARPASTGTTGRTSPATSRRFLRELDAVLTASSGLR